MRVLLIEDDEFIAKTLETVLIKENYAVDVAIDGEVGWRLIETFAYDMILLDIMLPKLDGITICRQLREREYQMPVLLITAQNSSSDRVIGLDAGADDYVAKPFELSELLARMRVLLRRGSSPVVPILEWNTLRLDPASCQVSYADRPLHLTPKEYRLLELFLRNPRHVFSRSSILEHLWGLDETPTEDTVTAHIKGLRQKLKQAGAPGNFIETVYGMGYRLKQSSLSLPSSPPTQTNGSDKTAPSLPSSPPAQTNGFDKTAKKPDERSEENSEQARKELEEIWRKQQTRSALRDVWGKYESYNHHRLQVIEQAIAALRENNLTGELRTQAQASAHKLAGTLGVFDLPEGSRLALELEQYFKSGHIPNAQGLQHLSSLVAGLKMQLQRNLSESVEVNQSQRNPLLLVIDGDAELANQTVRSAQSRSVNVKQVANLQTVWDTLTAQSNQSDGGSLPDAWILNFSLSDASQDDLIRLADLTHQLPPVPVLLLTDHDDLDLQIKLARTGVYATLPKLSSEQIVDRVMQWRSPHSPIRVMMVDDDPQVLAVMKTLLEPWGLEITTVERSPQFWNTLQTCTPDILILDVEMPHFNGIELCQAVRSVPRWRQLPILFLTIHTDAKTLHQVLNAGADALIGKPIAESDVVLRILSELERLKLLQLA